MQRALLFSARPWLASGVPPRCWRTGQRALVRRAGGGWFDRLLPVEDPSLTAYKAAERAIIREKLGRSRFAEFLAAHKDKGAPTLAGASAATASARFPRGLAVCDLGAGAAAGDAEADPCDFFGSARATLVTLAFAAVGQKQVEPWLAAFGAAHAPRRLFAAPAAAAAAAATPAALNLVYLDGWLFARPWLRGFFLSSVRGGVPPPAASLTGVVFCASEQATDHAVHALGLRNRALGHVFLVDADGRIRWRAAGDAAPGEVEALLAATRELLDGG
jgi:hypothetical protein